MITFFCPSCWGQVNEADKVCPHCGADIPGVQDQRDYVAKLIAALSHPEPTTPVRAAWILGQLRAKAAAGPLLAILRGDADLFVKAAAIEALGQIGDVSARTVLTELAESGGIVLRGKAAEALRRLDLVGRAE
jgi:HEAT repeat protein